MRSWRRIVRQVVLTLAAMAPAAAEAATYEVEGHALGSPVSRNAALYRAFACRDSLDYAQSTSCRFVRRVDARGGAQTISHALIHTVNDLPIYAMVNVTPTAVSPRQVEGEIRELTVKIGAAPADTKTLENKGDIGAVLVVWGDIRLQELNWKEAQEIKDSGRVETAPLVDYLGNPEQSFRRGLPVFRPVGGAGYVYGASFDRQGVGHRRYVALDAAALSRARYLVDMREVLLQDRSLPATDFSLLGKVAILTRQLALDSSADNAIAGIDQAFSQERSRKLHSHVWAALPTGAIERLGAGIFSRLDVYGPNTAHPAVRDTMLRMVRKSPSDPFIRFAHVVLGDFPTAFARPAAGPLQDDVLHYASGYSIVAELLGAAVDAARRNPSWITDRKAAEAFDAVSKEGMEEPNKVPEVMRFLSQHRAALGGRKMKDMVPDLEARAQAAIRHFEAVMSRPSSPHADDAGFMVGWLHSERGDTEAAIEAFGRTLKLGNGDYAGLGQRRLVQIIGSDSLEHQRAIISKNENLKTNTALLYLTTRTAYRAFDYPATIRLGRESLQWLGIPPDTLPATTDPARIEAALQAINPDHVNDLNLRELPYLVEAARDLSESEAYVRSAPSGQDAVYAGRVKDAILRYSLLQDQPQKRDDKPRPVAHRDIRQAIHLMDVVLREGRRGAAYDTVREWVHYRKVRSLALSAPTQVSDAIADMRAEFPQARLLNNALAEQVFAEGITLKNPDLARRTFQRMIKEFPRGRAIDNAYSWMSIIERCAGRKRESDEISRQIIKLFPLTRHAVAARERLGSTGGAYCY